MQKKTGVMAGAVLLCLAGAGALMLVNRQRDAERAPPAPAQAAAGAAAGARAAPGTEGSAPTSVSTVPALQRDQPVTLDATGTITPLSLLDVHPQLSALVTQVHVREGQFVQRGALLFTLDDRADQVNLAKARAQLLKDKAALADAQRQLARSRDLVRQQFLSQSALDTAQTLVESQQAAVASSQAAVDAAQLTLGFDRIAAPSAGRVGAINVYPGSYVQPGGPALLSITQLDPIAVAFSVPQRHLNDVLAGLRGAPARVQIDLPGTAGKAIVGKLQFVDSAVDAASGTVRLKAVVDNPGHVLWPGAYATVHMTVRTIAGAIVVPQEAIINSQEGDSVYVVGPDSTAVARKVGVLQAMGAEAVVSGVAVGEAVIIDGRRNVRAGGRVVVRNGAAAVPARKKASAAAP